MKLRIFLLTVRWVVVLTLLLALGVFLVAGRVEQEIFAPERRPMHSFHLERLNDPAEFGLRLRHHSCVSGKIPCLLAEPDAQAGPGRRGIVLREQLVASGITPPVYGAVKGTIVMLHGRNGRKESLLAVAERFVAAGFRCVIMDLPAHGQSSAGRLSFGSSEFERQLPAQVLREVAAAFDLPDEPVFLWGMSMGGAFALHAAQASERWAGVIVVSSFARLDELLLQYAQQRYRRYASQLIKVLDVTRRLQGKPAISAINPEQWAAGVTVPTLVVHGDSDYYVPMQHGRRLFEALPAQNKQWLTVPGGGHRNVLSTPMQLYAAMSAWMLANANLP